VVLVVGNRHCDEGEFIMNSKNSPGGDRDNLSLRAEEIALVKAATAANQNTVAVLIGGSAITLSDWEQDLAGILMAYYPGMEGGNAIARTLFGDVNPGGKLPFTIPTNAAHLPFFDKDAESIEYGYYHGYTLHEKQGNEPAYAFGYGGSYTSFELSDAKFSFQDGKFQAEVVVTNTGDCAGDEVVQLYVGCSESTVDRPARILRGFQRLSLEPGQSSQVTLHTGADTLNWYNEAIDGWQSETLPHELYIGTSSRQQDLLKGVVSPDSL
jgi:beta-glucosidase